MQVVSRKAEAAQSKHKRADYGSAKASEPLLLISTWSPSLDSQGTIQFLWALAYGKAGKIGKPLPGKRFGRIQLLASLHTALSLPIMFFLPMAIGTFTLAGYLAVARNVALDNLPRWWMYLREARRFWRPQMLLALLYMVAISPVAVIAALRPHALPFFSYLLLPLFFLTTLSPYAIIADRLRVIAAVKRSAMAIVRDPITAVLLIVGAGALGWTTYLFDPWRPALFTKVNPLTTSPFALLPRGILVACLRASIDSWFSLAAFLWYRDVAMRRS